MQKVGARYAHPWWMETHNSLVASFLLLFKTLLLFYSLKSLSLDSLCPMFSLIFLKVLALRLALFYVFSNL
jgi:hypothetical protein